MATRVTKDTVAIEGEWYDKALAKRLVQPGQKIRQAMGNWYTVVGTPTAVTEAASAARIEAAAGQAGPSPASATGGGTPAADIGGGTVPKGTTTPTPTPTPTQTQTQAPPSTGVPSGAMGDLSRKAIQEAGQVYGMDIPAPTVPGGLSPELRTVAEDAAKAFEYEKPVVAAQARKAKGALETTTEATFEYQAALGAEIAKIGAARGTASEAFATTIGAAEKYAGEAQQRTIEGLAKIDEWGKTMMETLDFSRAHDMEVAVHSTVDGLNQMERQTLQQYGADSDEYRQFQMSKGNTLAGILSTTQATYAKLQGEIQSNLMKAKSDFLTQSDMYTSFQQQQEVEIRAAMANAEAAFALDSSAATAQSEMMKMAGWEDLANWQLETPVFAVDSMGTVNFIAQLAMGEWQAAQAQQAAETAAGATKSAGRSQAIASVGTLVTMAVLMI